LQHEEIQMKRKKIIRRPKRSPPSLEPRLCGLCAAVHAPGEPHKTKRAKDIEVERKRVGGGYMNVLFQSQRHFGKKKHSKTSGKASTKSSKSQKQPIQKPNHSRNGPFHTLAQHSPPSNLINVINFAQSKSEHPSTSVSAH
jgi:hypothetical protein